MRRLMAKLAVLALLASCGYRGPVEEPVPREVKRAGEEVGEQASLLEVRDYLQRAFQPPPDRRFLLAVTEMARVASGEAPVTATAVWQENSWSVRYGENPVGSLPPWPVFADYWQLLLTFAQKLQPQLLPRLGEQDASEHVPEPSGNFLEQARELAKRWHAKPSPKTLASAARLATVLAAHHLDLLETGDEVFAHALALVALAEALGQEVHQEKAVLAFRLGYWPGDELLGVLGPQHPLVLLLNNKNQELEALASRSSHPLAVLFCAESLARRLLFSRALEAAGRGAAVDPWSLAWLRAAGEEHEMPVATELGRQAMVSAMAWARGEKPRAKAKLPEAQLIAAFERALSSRFWPETELFPRT